MSNDNGSLEVIEFAGEKERVQKNGAKNKHPVIGELTQARNEIKKVVIVNAVETAEISRFAENRDEHSHQWLDENGWENRTSYVMTSDSTIYPVILHIARTRDGRNILYDVNVKINEGVAADKNATSQRAEKQAGQAVRTTKPSIDKVAHTEPDVKEKFSLRDDDYIDAVNTGDMETAQKMVDAAAKAAGYTNLFYHGSKKGGGFTKFRDWSYFTENRQYAERYAERGNKGSLYQTFVKLEKPFDTRNTDDRALFDQIRSEYGLGEIQDTRLPDWTDGYDIADYIKENGLDDGTQSRRTGPDRICRRDPAGAADKPDLPG